MATIVLLTTLHPRSDPRIFVKEARTLAARTPHKVFLMVADGQGSMEDRQARVSIHDLGRLGGGRGFRAWAGPWRAFWAIGRIKPDVVHFHDPELIPLGLMLRALGCKIVYDVHEDVPRQILSKRWLPRWVRKPVACVMSAAEWFGARAFSAIVPATPKIAERFPAGKTVLIQNFPILEEMFSSEAIPYRERPSSFAYVGVITEDRGAVEMVRACDALGEMAGAKLELAGELSPAGLEETLRALSGWALVHYHGQVSRARVGQILGRVRAGLVLFRPLPNHIDAQPNKIFEYMSAGLPVVASDFPLWRRIIDGAG